MLCSLTSKLGLMDKDLKATKMLSVLYKDCITGLEHRFELLGTVLRNNAKKNNLKKLIIMNRTNGYKWVGRFKSDRTSVSEEI